MPVKYEWDEPKRQSNFRKHGVDFADAVVVFDGYTVTVEDTRFAYNESRFITVGLFNGRALVVAHTERRDTIRIISARKATKNEELVYFQQITNRLGTARRARRPRR